MSRTSAFLLLPLLLAVAGIAWVFFGGGGALPGEDEGAPEEERSVAEPSPPPLLEVRGPGLAGSGAALDPTRRRKPLWPILPTNLIPRGTIEVLPVYEDETPVDADDVRVSLEREPAFYSGSIGVRDRETGVWRFDKVVIGWLRVIVVGDHVCETTVRAQVSKGQVAKVVVVVQRAGAIAYQAQLYSGERPEQITLELRDPETKQPLEVFWAMRAPDAHSSPRKATRVDIGAEGVIFPVPPGRWILHATSAEGEIDQVDVAVEVGKTVQAEIQLRK